MRLLSTLCLAFVVAPVLAQDAPQGPETALSILVRDADTKAPLGGARLEVLGAVGATDAFGQAELVGMEPGPLPIRASFVGYAALDTIVVVEPGAETVAILDLASDAILLGNIEVSEERINDEMLRRRGFFDRLETLTGVFVTRDELDNRGASTLSDVFTSMPGVRIQREGVTAALVSARRRGCPMTVFLDGTEAQYLAQQIDAFPLTDVAAIEVYRGPSEVPVEYLYTKSGQTCGAVLIWTQIVVND